MFNNNLMKNSIEQKIFGPMIDKKLNFKSHINELCKKAKRISEN